MFVQFLISAAGRTGILQEETHHPERFERSELTGQEWWPAAKHQSRCFFFPLAADLGVQQALRHCVPSMNDVRAAFCSAKRFNGAIICLQLPALSRNYRNPAAAAISRRSSDSTPAELDDLRLQAA